ncbi:MAG: hypothetical protein FWD57_08725, partial [Polyangiaceae bacterium]|nr:hypothetical protein [Polyangiaceae bacterium]
VGIGVLVFIKRRRTTADTNRRIAEAARLYREAFDNLACGAARESLLLGDGGGSDKVLLASVGSNFPWEYNANVTAEAKVGLSDSAGYIVTPSQELHTEIVMIENDGVCAWSVFAHRNELVRWVDAHSVPTAKVVFGGILIALNVAKAGRKECDPAGLEWSRTPCRISANRLVLTARFDPTTNIPTTRLEMIPGFFNRVPGQADWSIGDKLTITIDPLYSKPRQVTLELIGNERHQPVAFVGDLERAPDFPWRIEVMDAWYKFGSDFVLDSVPSGWENKELTVTAAIEAKRRDATVQNRVRLVKPFFNPWTGGPVFPELEFTYLNRSIFLECQPNGYVTAEATDRLEGELDLHNAVLTILDRVQKRFATVNPPVQLWNIQMARGAAGVHPAIAYSPDVFDDKSFGDPRDAKIHFNMATLTSNRFPMGQLVVDTSFCRIAKGDKVAVLDYGTSASLVLVGNMPDHPLPLRNARFPGRSDADLLARYTTGEPPNPSFLESGLRVFVGSQEASVLSLASLDIRQTVPTLNSISNNGFPNVVVVPDPESVWIDTSGMGPSFGLRHGVKPYLEGDYAPTNEDPTTRLPAHTRLTIAQAVRNHVASIWEYAKHSGAMPAGNRDLVIVTGPNSLSKEARLRLEDAVQEVSSANTYFVSESDAAAFWCLQRYEQRFRGLSARVIVVDVGAGTLDISVADVEWHNVKGARVPKSITTIARGGYPIGVHCVDKLITHSLGRNLDQVQRNNLALIKERFSDKFTQSALTELGFGTLTPDKVKQLSIDTYVERVVGATVSTVKSCVGRGREQKDWYLTFTGRGSLLHGLRDQVVKGVEVALNNSKKIVVLNKGDTANDMKAAVAKGALGLLMNTVDLLDLSWEATQAWAYDGNSWQRCDLVHLASYDTLALTPIWDGAKWANVMAYAVYADYKRSDKKEAVAVEMDQRTKRWVVKLQDAHGTLSKEDVGYTSRFVAYPWWPYDR